MEVPHTTFNDFKTLCSPSLTCRDVQHLVVETSKRHDLQDDFSSWQRNGAGFYGNDFKKIYGF